MNSGIYAIRNLVNNKLYIGLAVNLKYRREWHFARLRKDKHCNEHLQKAFNKYGEDNFIFEVLEYCTEDLLFQKEHSWCSNFNVHDRHFGYNIKPTDPTGIAGQSNETKLKISNTSKERAVPDERRVRIADTLRGRKQTLDHIANAANARKGKVRGPYKMNSPVKAVNQLTGENIQFDSVSKCARHFKVPSSTISLSIKTGNRVKKLYTIIKL